MSERATIQSEYLTVNEFASLISVSQQTVKKWIKAGKITFTKLPGRGDYRIKKDYAKGWMERRTVKAINSFS
jgi:excisionase family DNA binding protein